MPLNRLVEGLMRYKVLVRLRSHFGGCDRWLPEENLFVELWLDGGAIHVGDLQQVVMLAWLDVLRRLLGEGCLALLLFRVQTWLQLF